MSNFPRPTMLIVLDGFGLNPNPVGNAIAIAHKPTLDKLFNDCPTATLTTHGEAVGLPAGQMGNSEVGHLNIGAGRVVEQWLLRISRALKGDFVKKSEQYQTFLANSKSGAVHVVGLFSQGGVHSHSEHMLLMVQRLIADGVKDIRLHLISDGRDTSPNAFAGDLEVLETALHSLPGARIATICGRFFAMDRDKRWERVEKAYRAIMLGEGAKPISATAYVRASYERNITDEFLEPAVLIEDGISADDSILFTNFREDRMREIVGALCVSNFDGFARPVPAIKPEKILCFTEYDSHYHLPFLFAPIEIREYLGEVISKQGLKQLRVAETEKYPHVTYFLNGGEEEPLPGEDRKMVPSPRDVKTYDFKPEMSALGVTDIVTDAIKSKAYDFIVVNFANCDMVGHTGNIDAAVRAVETVDNCLGRILKELSAVGGQAVIIADHGNADMMIDYDTGHPHTAHTTFPVPVILVGPGLTHTLKKDGALCDVAPTVLKMMNIPQPSEMTGKSLIN